MATTAGLVVLVLYVLSRRFSSSEEESECGGDYPKSNSRSAKRRLPRRPALAPATWLETMSTLSETLRFTYAETFGKWPIGDLAFGIKYFIQRQVGVLLSLRNFFFPLGNVSKLFRFDASDVLIFIRSFVVNTVRTAFQEYTHEGST